ncbi:MAG: zf-HC2 domain-containing protein [Planctomycetota bacterium]
MRGCARARRWMLQAVDGELRLQDRFRLDAHVEKCPACRAALAEAERIEEALLELPEPPLEHVDVEAAVRAVRARIDAPEATPETSVPTPPKRRVGGWAAAAALMAAAGAGWLLGGRGGSRLDAPAVDGPALAQVEEEPEPERAPEVEPEVETEAEDDTLVAERLEEVRARVAAELVESWQGIELLAARDQVALAADGFDARMQELSRGWPLLRIVQGLTVSPDRREAGAAVRYLGVRGDGIAAGALRDALDRPELAAAAVAALGDLGAAGLGTLTSALERPELGVAVVQQLVAVGGDEAAHALEGELARVARSLRSYPDEETEGRVELLLGGLTTLEPPAVASLLRLAEREILPRSRVLGLLQNTYGAGEELSRLVVSGRAGADEELLLDALARVRPPAALPWIEARATERGTREQALACLAAFREPEALEILVRLRASGRARPELVLEATSELLAEAPAAGVELARRWNDAGDRLACSELAGVLLELAAPQAVPALSALVLSPALDDDERQWAAVAVGELGARADAGAMAEAVRSLGAGEERIAAACLLAACALGGADLAADALDALGPLSGRAETRLVALFDEAEREGTRAATLYRVARELEPYFDLRQATGNL